MKVFVLVLIFLVCGNGWTLGAPPSKRWEIQQFQQVLSWPITFISRIMKDDFKCLGARSVDIRNCIHGFYEVVRCGKIIYLCYRGPGEICNDHDIQKCRPESFCQGKTRTEEYGEVRVCSGSNIPTSNDMAVRETTKRNSQEPTPEYFDYYQNNQMRSAQY